MATQNAAPPNNFNAEEADNFEDIEKQFAVKTVHHMLTYWSILERMPGSKLRLTKHDDAIYEHFTAMFPEIDVGGTLDEDAMKSKEGKEKWRKFIKEYEDGEKKIEDFNYGTMLRRNPSTEYGEHESMFAVRMQFYAIEIARNRKGLNDWVFEKSKVEGKMEKPKE